MPSVEYRSVTKQYGKLTVIKRLNLTIGDGDFVVLLGPSGCGKTTLLNMLAGLQDVTGGSIFIDGKDVTEFDPKDRGLAMVFQSYALYPTKTVRGNLKFGLAAQRLSRSEIRRRVDAVAEMLQIDELMDRKPAQLSGGQRQRVAIGRALVKNVDIFLFDEPLSNLDAKLRTEMRIEIKRLHAQLGSTVVYVTHDQIEAMTMATKIAVLNDGVIQQVGTPDSIYASPANLFVAGFIGSPAMNILEGELTVVDGVVSAQLGNGQRLELDGYEFAQAPQDGQRVKLGLRPEHFVVGNEGNNSFRLPVVSSERTGSDATIFCELEADAISVRTDPGVALSMVYGELVTLSFPAGKINVFDAQSGNRI